MTKKIFITFTITFVVVFFGSFFLLRYIHLKDKDPKPEDPGNNTKEKFDFYDFDFKIIKNVSDDYPNKNVLVSPLSIGYALSMLNEGAQENTKTQISSLLGNYKIEDTNNVENHISIANGLFIKDVYKDTIKDEFTNVVKNKYSADVIYDEFKSPDVINNWISNKTYNMIDKVIEDISSDFVLAIANTIAIDVEWANKFECERTKEEDFTLSTGEKMKTAMMHSSDDVLYIKTNKAQGIIKSYKTYDGNELQYIAILPNGNINQYLYEFNEDELSDLLNSAILPSKEVTINYSLPKYTYDFDFDNFQNALQSLGMTDAFDSQKANFDNITNDIYVSKAIHKAHIELSENGTKAAAVTVFMMDKNSAEPIQKRVINVVFDKPFVYLIKDKSSNNIWFFGTVNEPLKFEDHKCETKDESLNTVEDNDEDTLNNDTISE